MSRPELNLFSGDHATPSTWGDYDNDGRPDLVRLLVHHASLERARSRCTTTPATFLRPSFRGRCLRNGATHGIQWVDFDGNGALDIAMANNNPERRIIIYGATCFRPSGRARSIQVYSRRDAERIHNAAGIRSATV